jgi:hypothetical protein
MRRALVVGALLFVVGCQGVVGPFQRGAVPPSAVDCPCLTIPEQEARGREYLALPQKSADIGPRTGAEEPSYRRTITQNF